MPSITAMTILGKKVLLAPLHLKSREVNVAFNYISFVEVQKFVFCKLISLKLISSLN
jgi:hypothetical protein